MDETELEADHARVPARRGRLPGRDDDHRVGPRHPAGEHADRRARRRAGAGPGLPDPGPRRAAPASAPTPTCSTRPRRRSSPRPAARLATLSDYTELGSGLRDRHAGPRAPRRRRPAGRRAVGPRGRGRLRALRLAARRRRRGAPRRGRRRAGRRRGCGSTSTSTPTCPPTTSRSRRPRSTSTGGSRGRGEPGELRALRDELRDRFGPVPEPVENLLELQRARIELGALGRPHGGVPGRAALGHPAGARRGRGRAPSRGDPGGDVRVARQDPLGAGARRAGGTPRGGARARRGACAAPSPSRSPPDAVATVAIAFRS